MTTGQHQDHRAAFKTRAIRAALGMRAALDTVEDSFLLVDHAAFAVAVFPDPGEPDGFGIASLKGEQHAEAVMQRLGAQRPAGVPWTSIPLASAAAAEAFRREVVGR